MMATGHGGCADACRGEGMPGSPACHVQGCVGQEGRALHECQCCGIVYCTAHNGGVWATPICRMCRARVSAAMREAATRICVTCWGLDAGRMCDGCGGPVCDACHYRGEGACRRCHDEALESPMDSGRPSTPVDWEAEPEQPCRACGEVVWADSLSQCGCRRWICQECSGDSDEETTVCPGCR